MATWEIPLETDDCPPCRIEKISEIPYKKR